MAPAVTCTCGQCQKCKHRAYMRDYYRRDPQRVRDIANASRARRIEKVRAYDNARGNRSDPEKARVRKAVHTAISKGLLARGECEVGLDCRGRIEGHHDDYSRPLDVRWLCQKHHLELHRRVAA